MDSQPIFQALKSFFAANPGDAAAVYVFGSVGRGTARKGSDVDVGVLLEADPPHTLQGLKLDLQADLELLLASRPTRSQPRFPPDLVLPPTLKTRFPPDLELVP